jgi:hypothetical protein
MTRLAEAARAIAWLLMCAFVVGGLVLLIVGATGCASSTQTALASLTRTVTAAVPEMNAERKADGAACFPEGATYEAAKACVDDVESEWALAWAALDMLEQVDEAALAGELRVEDAVRAYCVLLTRFVTLPALPPVLGRCE